jgi:drug/metabolite transporter (DMT)-like permease
LVSLRESRWVPYFRLFSAQLAIGAAAIFARYALTGAGPLAVSALRLILAALPLAVLALLARPRVRLSRKREVAFALAGLALALHFAAWIGSLLYTSVAISTLLVTTTPLFTESYDALVEHRIPGREYLVAVALAFAGVALIASQHATPAPVPGQALLGNALALGGAIAIAAYLLIVRSAGARPLSGPPLPTRQIVARTYGWAALVLTVLALFTHQTPPPLGDAASWFGILAMALVSQLLGHTALNAALRTFTPSVVSLTTLLEPLIAALLAAALFREGLSLATIVGGALVLAAVALTLRSTNLPPLAGQPPVANPG